LLAELAERFGRQCVVQAIDAKRVNSCDDAWSVWTHAGTRDSRRDAVEFGTLAAMRGAGEILLTSIDRDGTGTGYDLELLRALARAVEVPVIASGGGGTAAQLRDAIVSGASAVLVASILHDGLQTVGDLKQELMVLGVRTRADEGAGTNLEKRA
jgi:cyclase